MKIKKVLANTEKEAIEKIKRVYGENSLILSIQRKQPNGLFGFLKKPQVLVTVAYDIPQVPKLEPIEQKVEEKEEVPTENVAESEKEDLKEDRPEEKVPSKEIKLAFTKEEVEQQNKERDEELKAGKDRIKNLESMLDSMAKKLMASQYLINNHRMFDNSILQTFYDALVAQGVLEHAAQDILSELAERIGDEEGVDISHVAVMVYQKIIEILGKTEPITMDEGTLFVYFVGPTGVGKTTTIAKLASRLVLEQKINVGFITADTYRIAAVEQLKVYAEILNLDIDVVYETDDFIRSTSEMKKTKEIVFVDTAGRSHKGEGKLLDLKELIDVPLSNEKFLVLSMTTKYEDLVNIINTYSDIGKFKLILTKFDETTKYGNIFNLCYEKGLEVVYITTGQNVPDDIEIIKPEKIAKALLGLDVGL